jgi:hypothetical protein
MNSAQARTSAIFVRHHGVGRLVSGRSSVAILLNRHDLRALLGMA